MRKKKLWFAGPDHLISETATATIAIDFGTVLLTYCNQQRSTDFWCCLVSTRCPLLLIVMEQGAIRYYKCQSLQPAPRLWTMMIARHQLLAFHVAVTLERRKSYRPRWRQFQFSQVQSTAMK